uniref:Uncharacterized protein n=1 Tax=Theileria annulata TaxID=5874 RepID=A0A3B0N056_THEAN
MEELEELRLRVITAYPNVEKDIEILFNTNDISNENLLPYDIVEALLRHYLLQQGFQDYIFTFLNSNGMLDLKYIRNYLHENNMLVVNEETMLNIKEMKLLAIIWLKLLSDSYFSKTFNQPNYLTHMTNNNTNNTNNQFIHITTNTLTNSTGTDGVGGTEGTMGTNGTNGTNGTGMGNGMEEEEEIMKYMKNIKDEIEKNKMCGIKCYTYPASLIPNGSCASAGAIIPHRRLKNNKPIKNIFTLFGCC